MSKRKVYLRADASAEIGYGHFIRSLALADMLKDEFECIFFTQAPSEYQKLECSKVCPLIALPSDDSKFQIFLEYLSGEEIVVLDNYFFSTEYQEQIKSKGCKLVCIDGMHDKHYLADVVINQCISDPTLINCEPYTYLCLGLDWALLRRCFLEGAKQKRTQGKWFISFGGSDMNNLTSKFLHWLESDLNVKQVTVVLGDSYQYLSSLNNLSKSSIKKNISAYEIMNEMASSEYALLPSSTMCIEALACGCKVISGFYVDNQKEFSHNLMSSKYIYYLGDMNSLMTSAFIQKAIDYNYSCLNNMTNIAERYIQLFNKL